MNKNNIIKLSMATILSLQIGAIANTTNTLNSVDVVSEVENEGSYRVKSMATSTKLNLSIKDTPQSVSVVTASQLEDSGITTYDQLLQSVAGVTLQRWDERLVATARGFEIDYYKIDGVPTYEVYNDRALDLSLYEKVEVVRGANGLTTGAGNPGISINLVRKKADSKETKGELSLGYDSEGSIDVTADVAGALNDEGTIRARVLAKHEDAESFMDGYKKDKTIFSGIVDADINDNSKLSAGFTYEKTKRSGNRWGGLPAFNDDGTSTDFDNSLIVSEDWTKGDDESKLVYFNFEHYITQDAILNVSYSYEKYAKQSALFYLAGPASDAGMYYYTWLDDIEETHQNLDANINLPFQVGGLTHELVVGATFNKKKVTKYDGIFGYNALQSFYNYDIEKPATSTLTQYYKPYTTKQKAVYLASKILISNNLKLIAGTRVSTYESNYDDNYGNAPIDISNEITPYLGLVYDLNKETSLYTSYTSIFKPQDKIDSSGKTIEPITGNSYEMGVKGDYLDEKLTASLNLFHTKQDNVSESTEEKLDGKTVYKEVDGVTSKGIEIDVIGKINDELTINFAIANFKAETADGTKYDTKSARTTSNLAAKYVEDKFTYGVGVDYQSKIYTEDETFGTITQDAYTLFNAMVEYQVNKSLSAQFNVKNIFDKSYYEGIASNGMTYGEPRTFKATLKYSF